jgi:anti-sigma regulatory factor (Ser/Thr protein kinase)
MTVPRAPTTPSTVNHLEVLLINDLGELKRLADIVSDFIQASGLAEEIAFQMNVCFDELITNTVSYGYRDKDRHEIRVRLTVDGSRVSAEIEDDGDPFNPFLDAPPPDLDSSLEQRRIGGLGIHLVRTMTKAHDYCRLDGRNITRLMY